MKLLLLPRSKPCSGAAAGGADGAGDSAPGLIAGAIIGGGIAAATSPWNGYNSGYYGGYPAYGYEGYAAAPEGYVTVVPGAGDPGYCARRFRSYDPGSGTYLGYDGVRHPCP